MSTGFWTDLTQHSTARKQWRISLWSVHSCRHDRNTFSASPYHPASDKKPPGIKTHKSEHSCGGEIMVI